MIKKIFENKKLIILTIALIVIIAGIVIAVVMNRGPKENNKINPGIETENDNDKLKDEAKDEKEPGVEDEIGSPADSIDGSGSWDDVSDSNNQEKQEDTDNSNQSNNTGSDDQPEDKKEETISDENVLIDDKEWGDIN